MIAPGKMIRLKRFTKDDRTLIVAMDHGIIGVIEGIQNLGRMIDIVARSGADAIMVNVGIVRNYSNEISGKVGLVAAVEYDEKNVEEAVRVACDAIKTTYFGKIPLDENRKQQINEIAFKSDAWGMPFIAELIPVDSTGNTIFDGDTVRKAARICAELGADMVKTTYTGSSESFRKVVESCPVPIVIAGGPKMDSDVATLKMIRDSIEAGGAGVAMGRNIWQHKNPAKMTEAVAGIIHRNITVDEAIKIVQG